MSDMVAGLVVGGLSGIVLSMCAVMWYVMLTSPMPRAGEKKEKS